MHKIETTHLWLRPLEVGDIDALHSIWNEPGVRKYLWDDQVVPREQVEEIITLSRQSFRDKQRGLWAVLPPHEETLIGFAGFWLFHDPPQLELLYGLSTEHWGKGFATEAAAAVMKYGFERLSFSRIVASTDAPNEASVKVMQRLSMSFWKRENTNGLDTIYYFKD